ncbi:hypothetical protein [Bradyrhizobium sp.]
MTARLPHAGEAIFDIGKIEDDCLNAMVRTIWIVRSGESVPRFVSRWVLS